MAVWQSIQSVAIIILIIALGYVLRRRGMFAEGFSGNISMLITKIALPASIFVSVLHYLKRSELGQLGVGLICPFIGVGIAYAVGFLLVRVLSIPVGRRGIFINGIVNANTIFIGLPLNMALFGDASMKYFLIYYVVNTVSTWTIGAFLIANDSAEGKGQTPSLKTTLKKVLPPPLLGFIAGVLYLLIGLPLPDVLGKTLSYIGSLVTPLSLIFIGIVLSDSGLSSIRFDRDTIITLLGRFVLSPLVLAVLLWFTPFNITLKQVLVMQAATPMLAVLPVLARQAGGDVRFATNIVTTSTVLFAAVAPVVMWLLHYMA